MRDPDGLFLAFTLERIHSDRYMKLMIHRNVYSERPCADDISFSIQPQKGTKIRNISRCTYYTHSSNVMAVMDAGERGAVRAILPS